MNNETEGSAAEPVPQVSGAERVEHENDLARLTRVYREEEKVDCYIPTDSTLAQTAEFRGPDGAAFIVVRLGPTQHFVPVGVTASVPKTVGFVIEESLRLSREARERELELSSRARSGPAFTMER